MFLSANALNLDWSKILSLSKDVTFPKQQIFYSSKFKALADGNFKFDEYGRKFSKQVENTVGKGEIAWYEQFLLLPLCFQKACTADRKNQVLFGKGLTLSHTRKFRLFQAESSPNG